MALRALAPHPVLELALDLVESAIGRRMRGRGGTLVGWSLADEDLAPRNADSDGDVEAFPVTVMMARQLDHDVA